MKWKFSWRGNLVVLFITALFAIGCASSKINWESRVGNYTFDQAILEMGPPERSAKLSDGRIVAEWLAYRGGFLRSNRHYYPYDYWSHSDPVFPDRYLRLTFSPEGSLQSWKKVAK